MNERMNLFRLMLGVWAGMAFWGAGASFAQTEALSAFESFAGARKVSGTVFSDSNGNGVREPGEPGLPGVRIMADKQAAVTGADGGYVMEPGRPFLTVSVSFPSGYWPVSNRWYHRPAAEVEAGVDFALRPDRQDLPFLFAHFTDPHLGLAAVAESMPAEAGVWPVQPKFYLCGGDLRQSTVSTTELEKLRKDFGVMRDAFAGMKAPVFAVPGNHDVVDLRSGTKFPPEVLNHPLFGQRAWEKWVGPASWSFTCGGVRFIGQEWAEYLDDKGWESNSKGIAKWMEEERASRPEGGRAVVLCHASPAWAGDLALSGHTHALGPTPWSELTLMGGQSGGHYTEVEWDQGTALRESMAFVERVAVRGRPDLFRRYGEDGCPTGYRLVAVYPDRLDNFYKVLGEPRTIMVNAPRRHRAVTVSDGIVSVRGQVFDPDGTLERVTVSCGASPVQAEVKRSLLWVDFTAALDAADWTDGCRTLVVRAKCGDGTYELAENYVFLTGRSPDFSAPEDVVLKGWVERGKTGTEITVNGETVGSLRADTREFQFPVRSELLRRLNAIALKDAGTDPVSVKNVHLLSGGKMFADQRLTSGFGMGRSLRVNQSVYIDLAVPGKARPWQVALVPSP